MTEEANTDNQGNTDADGGVTTETETEKQSTGTESQDAGTESEGAEGEKGGEKDEGESFIGAPESYELPELPEGMAVDEAALEVFKEFALKEDISQDGFQKLAALHADIMQKGNEGYMESLLTAARQQQEAWVTEIKQDKEIGGAKFEETIKGATAAVDRFEKEAPGLKALLDQYDPETNPTGTGLANNPTMVKLFNAINGLIGGDNPGTMPEGSQATDRIANLYPSMKN